MSTQEENNKVCPYLASQEGETVCLGTMTHVIYRKGGQISLYQPVLSFEVPKCETIWKNCPHYQKESFYREWQREWQTKRIQQ